MAKAWNVDDIAPEKSLQECAHRIIATRFDEMMSYKCDVAEGNPAGVYDMRVSSRRLQSAMQNFVDCFQDKKKFRKRLKTVKKVTDTLGGIRDVEVLIARFQKDIRILSDIEQIGVQNLINRLQQEHEEKRQPVLETFEKLERYPTGEQFLEF